MNDIDVSLEYNQVFEGLSANGTLMRTFTHVIYSYMTFHYIFAIEM